MHLLQIQAVCLQKSKTLHLKPALLPSTVTPFSYKCNTKGIGHVVRTYQKYGATNVTNVGMTISRPYQTLSP